LVRAGKEQKALGFYKRQNFANIKKLKPYTVEVYKRLPKYNPNEDIIP